MKREEIIAKMAESMERYEMEKTVKGSTGSFGKAMDVVVRDFLLAKGNRSFRDCSCRKASSPDVRIKLGGRFVVIEIKSGCGAVAYDGEWTKEDITPGNICKGADFIAWCPYVKEAGMDWLNNTYMFTREQFIQVLESIGKNGLQSSVKVNNSRRQLNIQTLGVKPRERLDKLLPYFPTVRQWRDDEKRSR